MSATESVHANGDQRLRELQQHCVVLESRADKDAEMMRETLSFLRAHQQETTRISEKLDRLMRSHTELVTALHAVFGAVIFPTRVSSKPKRAKPRRRTRS